MNQNKNVLIYLGVGMFVAALLMRVFDHYEISLIYYALTCAALLGIVALVKNKLEKTK